MIVIAVASVSDDVASSFLGVTTCRIDGELRNI